MELNLLFADANGAIDGAIQGGLEGAAKGLLTALFALVIVGTFQGVDPDALFAQLDADPGLGPAESVYPKMVSDRRPAVAMACAAFTLAVAGGFVLAAFFTTVRADPVGFPTVLGFGSLVALLGLVALALGLMNLGKPIERIGTDYAVCEGGLAVVKNGRLAAAHRLEDLRVRKGRMPPNPVGTALSKYQPPLSLADRDGRNLSRFWTAGLKTDVIRHLQANMADHLAPKLLAELEAGGRVDFGAVALRKGALVLGDREVRLATVGGVRFAVKPEGRDAGCVMMSAGGEPVNVTNGVFNVWLFVTLVRGMAPDAIPKSKKLKELLT